MKTGGTSFADIVRASFKLETRYPDTFLASDTNLMERMRAYMHTPTFIAEVNKRSENLQLIRAHVPYAARSLLERDYTAITILREPVARTLSYLKHCRHYHAEHAGMSLEAIYEQDWFRRNFIDNYQTRIFSMSATEAGRERRREGLTADLPPLQALLDGAPMPDAIKKLQTESPARFALELFSIDTGFFTVDQSRLTTAVRNLESVELVGVTERYDQFVGQLRDRYGWRTKKIPRQNVSVPDRVNDALSKRIADDNAFDMALYELAARRAA